MFSKARQTQQGDAPRIVKLTQREHILHRPSMYIGSIEPDTLAAWAPETPEPGKPVSSLVRGDLEVNMGLYKIFDEILVNASDHAARMSMRPEAAQVRVIKVDLCDPGTAGEIVVMNDGEGLDTSLQAEHDLHGPELLFGNLLCSTNYGDTTGDSTERITGGQNGIGSKATNVMSLRFEVDTVDAERKKRYVQEWRNNMSVVGAPKITAAAKKPYTKVTFLPDYSRFGMTCLTKDMHDLFVKRVLDLCAITPPEVSVFLNGVKMTYKDLEQYATLYLGPKGGPTARGRVYAKLNPRWEIVAAGSDSGFTHVSFVNGVWTAKGGRHVDAVAAVVCKKLSDYANKRRGQKATVKPQFVRDNLFLVVKSTVPDAAFDSQSKDYMTTPPGRFGVRIDVEDSVIEKLAKVSGILERCDALASAADDKKAAKTDGSKKSRITGIPALDDANWAGTAKSAETVLIMCEGLSAKTMAVAGLSEVGRDRYGIFPLRGKLLNVRDSAVAKVAANAEITAIKKILGLEVGKSYKDVSELRYGRIMIMTDADVDGSHIKALVLNAFATMWPSLYRMEGFITTMLTPIVKATKGKEAREFYNLTDFKAFLESGDARGWSSKWLKGLGSSSAAEAKGYFRDLRVMRFVHDDASDETLSLAFDKKRADDRKAWLEQYDSQVVLEVPPMSGGGGGVPLTHGDFVNKELIHFSDHDLQRSIPSAIDGLKPSQRKILTACIKRKLTTGEIRVAQLSGYVSESMQYHHGEVSLQGAIVGMAQDFIGSNNVNLLLPIGQHGSRLCGGSDAASARYIHTRLSDAATLLYRPEDAPILEYLEDDGVVIEPKFFVPIVPAVLLNGAVGIGTGFSTSVPSYDPLDVINNVRAVIKGEEPSHMTPWYRGFTGEIIYTNDRWYSIGRFVRKSAAVGEITELPIGTWTENYKEFLETLVGGPLRTYENQCSDVAVRFILKFQDGATLDSLLEDVDEGFSKLMTTFKLVSNKGLSVSNIHLYGPKGAIRKYQGTSDVIREHHAVRLQAYAARKAKQVADLESELELLAGKARFVREVISGEIALLGIKGAVLEALLEEREYPRIEDSYGHLTRLHVSTLTAERASAMEEDAILKGKELEHLKGTDASHIWLKELDELEVHLKKCR
jgi:DNA topoisomerase II